MDTDIRKYSIEEFNALIESIKRKHSINEEEITRRLKYNEGYISQTRSRKIVSAKLINSLMREFGISNITVTKPETIASEPETVYNKPEMTIQALFNLTESNRLLAESNKTLAESHQVLVGMVQKSGNYIPNGRNTIKPLIMNV